MLQAASFIGSMFVTVQLLGVARHAVTPLPYTASAVLVLASMEALLLLLCSHLVLRPLLLLVFVGRQPGASGWLRLLACLTGCALVATATSEAVGQAVVEQRHIQEVKFNTGSSEFVVEFHGWRLFAMQALNTLLAYAMWVVVYLTWKAVESRRQLQKQVRHARLWLLTRQMGPHFLFNTFNSIRGLVFADPERAAHMITQLSDLLRYQLGLDQRTHQSLDEECAVARNYLEIEATRLDPRLSFTFDIGSGCGAFEIPALTVLTAVENAVKHGVAPNPEPGWVRVSAHKGVQGWVLEVVNSCDRPSSSPSTGIGLRNLAERLALSSNGRSHVEHWREAGTFHLRVELPA
jgi:hypothetical protein